VPGSALAAAIANWSGATSTSPLSYIACCGPPMKADAAAGLLNKSRMYWISAFMIGSP
jgi:hypothetical protein